jgi:dissimilatory sulfite reductase (desulfoviridin) alpha/beta subunit
MSVIAVKYCGGCNPRYDRVKLVRDLQEEFPEHNFFNADAPNPDFVVVVCGCPVRCVKHEHITGRQGKFIAASPEDRELLTEAMRRMSQLK